MNSKGLLPAPAWKIWAALLVLYTVWSSTYLAILFAVQSLPPFLLAAIRFLIAGSILYAFRRIAGGDPKPARIEWRSAAIVGLLLLLCGNGGVVWAEQRIASGIAAVLVGTVPLWMVLLDALRPGGSKPDRFSLIGVLIGFLGILILVGGSTGSGDSDGIDLLGAVVVLFAAFSWAAGSLYSRSAHLPQSSLLGTAMEMLAGGAALLLLSALTGELWSFNPAEVTALSWGGLVYLIVFGSWVGFAAYTWLLRHAPTPLVSTYAYVNPLVAILIGTLLAQEPLTPRIILASLIIVGSVALTTLARAWNRPAVPAVVSSD